MKSYLKRQIGRLLKIHIHTWVLKYDFTSSSTKYGHEAYKCECGCIKHIKRFYNRKPIVVIINKNNEK